MEPPNPSLLPSPSLPTLAQCGKAPNSSYRGSSARTYAPKACVMACRPSGLCPAAATGRGRSKQAVRGTYSVRTNARTPVASRSWIVIVPSIHPSTGRSGRSMPHPSHHHASSRITGREVHDDADPAEDLLGVGAGRRGHGRRGAGRPPGMMIDMEQSGGVGNGRKGKERYLRYFDATPDNPSRPYARSRRGIRD